MRAVPEGVRVMKRVGTKLFSAEHAAAMLETDVETIRRMVTEDHTLPAIVVCRAGSRQPLRLAGLHLHVVNDDCSVTDWRGKDAGNLRFDVLALLPFRESVVNRQESAAITKRESSKDAPRRRYQMCLDAGLQMPTNDYGHLPTGIGSLADREGISVQAFSKSVKKHLATLPR